MLYILCKALHLIIHSSHINNDMFHLSSHNPVLSSFIIYYRVWSRVMRQVPHVEQELLTLPLYMSSLRFLVGLVLLDLWFSVDSFVDHYLSLFCHCIVCPSSICDSDYPLISSSFSPTRNVVDTVLTTNKSEQYYIGWVKSIQVKKDIRVTERFGCKSKHRTKKIVYSLSLLCSTFFCCGKLIWHISIYEKSHGNIEIVV